MGEALSDLGNALTVLFNEFHFHCSLRGQAFILYGNWDTLSLSLIADNLAEVLLTFDP